MPPKKSSATKADKNQAKAKAKSIEDKTFGLKNKNKSAKVGKYVEEMKKQAKNAGNAKARAAEEEKRAAENRKKAEEAKKKELHDLLKPVITQKVPFGTDPKTVLCAHFKAGVCLKGNKCKFSHDLSVERKSAKKDIYTDVRDQKKVEDTMDQWDEAKLNEVVLSKHGNPKTTTDIVCKYFLEAIETEKYGWFWECPNGGTSCKYRHALPPGFVLKSKRKEEEVKEEISIEEFLETERHKLGSNLTPVTLESFTEWKRKRIENQQNEANELKKAKEAAFKSGKGQVQLSGRELFDYHPELAMNGFDDEEDAFEFEAYKMDDNEKKEKENDRVEDVVNGVKSLAV